MPMFQAIGFDARVLGRPFQSSNDAVANETARRQYGVTLAYVEPCRTSKMSPAVADRLREFKKERRGKTRLLKDIPPLVLAGVACDQFDLGDQAHDPEDLDEHGNPTQWAYLSYASPEQITCLREHLTWDVVTVGSPIGPRRVVIFSAPRLRFALEYLVTKPNTYFRRVRR